MGLWRWFVDSQFPRSSRRGQDQDARRRGYNDARAGKSPKSRREAYMKGYAAGAVPAAVVLGSKKP